MLLYHFPLNTQESIENFTNVGLLQDYSLKGKQESPVNEGVISQKCLETKTNTFSVLMNSPEKFTVAFRFRLKSLTNGAWTTLICFYQNTTNRRSIYWNAGTTKLYFGGTPVNPDLAWHNVVVEYHDNTCSIYLDNILVDTTHSQTFTAISLFDRFYDKNYTLQAYIQDIRIYDYTLSQAEINEYSRALVVHYPLQGNELNPSVLKDVSGFGNDLLIDSTTDLTNSIDSPRGLRSISLGRTWFRGNSNRTQLKNGNLKGKTFAWWYKPLNVTNSSTLVGMQFISFTYNSNKAWLSCVFLLNDRNEINNVQGIYFESENNNWIHCVVVIDDAAEKILFYKNGIYQRELKRESITQTNAKDGLFLGEVSGIFNNPWNWGSPQNIFYSAFSDFRIYATALSAEDIKNLYNSPISVSNQHQTMAFEFVEGNDGFSVKKNGIVQHNELRENDSDVNGCYNDKLITNELIEQ